MKEQQQRQPLISVEEFFYDDPNTPWKPLPEHDLKLTFTVVYTVNKKQQYK
jgi:hypothetical protein